MTKKNETIRPRLSKCSTSWTQSVDIHGADGAVPTGAVYLLYQSTKFFSDYRMNYDLFLPAGISTAIIV